ncbi:zinc iron ABC transporter, ATP-binding protein [Companilactobacillus paralimentarius DSM 13238 = JCM 10415]|jgi:ABC-type Mn/Zn transport systems, ATPase component|uniref:Zinc iron ABC transporter, ATP-binding protein n=1 Tax=Companilactobacillus paralimentarius DSM 13238 = JCM 10415 TaxID=1122151 RepID=A0A0R1PFX4_9LACO|nr:ATP-binding cassette domain-containing protein [Companilactobacillus paralimentarius]KAE9563359.1 ABC transporter ATP-binding protein [Companilactobacillus paralimentarius]KRL31341.1 zinc iron ABC transporter, ATP-binding protein [Companilactobacillus paralimentarius DSM 13238 = JCM 10415]MDR4932491.1 ATP-binding cassette domain-containing protein [Companilactobacillus paralimentarius]QFR69099.1 ATP-binding cassette domain-containing protein [Companilactobacillus paralimentarius]
MIKVENLSKRFGNQLVFENLNFQINDGDFISLVGPNGSGKTTLVKIIIGLEKPSSGTIQTSSQTIGYVPQFRNVDSDYPLSIEQFIRLNLKVTLNPEKRRQNNLLIKTILKRTGLTEIKDRPLGLASGGEKQKAYLAQALLNDPKILILDESTASLDVEVKTQLMDLVQELNHKYHITVIFITHDYDLTKKYTKKALLFKNKTIEPIDVQKVSKDMFEMEG